jgi:pilus assembly protein CpaE
VREVWHLPFEAGAIGESLERLKEALREQPGGNEGAAQLHAFLPAKPGSGTSTVAVNTAMALARAEQRRVLLADFDLQEGIAKFLLKLGTAFSAVDALEKVAEIDEALWAEVVAKTNLIDVLASGPVAARLPYTAGRIRRLIEFMRGEYATTVLDLPGRLDEMTLEALEQASRILVVCTPDLPTLFLAKEKVKYLEHAGLAGRVSLLLNRWTKQAPVTLADIESLLGLPVQQSIREDAEEVWQAVLKGGGVAPLSPLGGEYAALAQSLSELPAARPVTARKRMVEYFTLSPGRYTLPQGRG